jgi:hypothetical protein
MYGLFSHSFELHGITFALVQSGSAYELRINGFPFNYLVELTRNKELFNRKEHHVTTTTTKVHHETSPKVYIKPLFDFKIKPTAKLEKTPKATPHKAFTFEEVSQPSKHEENLLELTPTKRDSFPTITEIFENNKMELNDINTKINENFKRSASLNSPEKENKAQALINSLNDLFVNKDKELINNAQEIFEPKEGQYPELGKVNFPNYNTRERVASDLFN